VNDFAILKFLMKYYAVRKGLKPGIYKTWLDCSANVTGVRGAEFKSFECLNQAHDFMLNATFMSNDLKSEEIKEIKSNKNLTVLEIYTDGACKSNGKIGSKAGYGVYFGEGDDRNVSKKLKGAIQSNNRAELMGVIEALILLNSIERAIIYTDSQYVQKGLESWISNWKKRNWKTSTGTDVLNQDLWKLLDKEKAKKPLAQVKYVKGHAGIKGNEEADKLAVAGSLL